jgi:hypothetical protein
LGGWGDDDAQFSATPAVRSAKKDLASITTAVSELLNQHISTPYLTSQQVNCLQSVLLRRVGELNTAFESVRSTYEIRSLQVWVDAQAAFDEFTTQFNDVSGWLNPARELSVGNIKVCIDRVIRYVEDFDTAPPAPHDAPVAGNGFVAADHVPRRGVRVNGASGWRSLRGLAVNCLGVGVSWWLLLQSREQLRNSGNLRGAAWALGVASVCGIYVFGKNALRQAGKIVRQSWLGQMFTDE